MHSGPFYQKPVDHGGALPLKTSTKEKARVEVVLLRDKTGAARESELNGSGNVNVAGYSGRVGDWESG